jgi:hypothetical protein
MPARRPILGAVALATAVALGAVVAPRLWDAPDGGRIAARPRPPTAGEAASDALPSDGGTSVTSAPRSAGVFPAGNLPAPLLSRRWQRHARSAVDQWVATTPHADTVTPAERESLVAALGDLRRAALASRRREGDGAWQARQSARIAAADRVFRDTVGSGVSEFLATVSAPEHVVDLGAAGR